MSGPHRPRPDQGARGGAVHLPVAEVFGATVQGEGPAAGRLATFVRLGGCNLSCSWCDTSYTWDGARFDLRTEITSTAVETIAAKVTTDLVVITGGEPLLHQERPGWTALLRTLTQQQRTIHVETNGTVPPTPMSLQHVAMWVVSPKLRNAGTHRGRQRARLATEWPALAAQHDGRAHLKIVCEGADDVQEAARLAERWGWPAGQVWAMPQGASVEQLAQTWPAVVEAAAAAGLNASHRLHVLAWGQQRGH
ncbi:7-carboxy-7-deazaguanine synthase QueE [Frankia sp. AvcI1]|uniref:7-carboxy-7-deazaguanine synthase QueE n=1 Tax=Frankia sp. AvcI1 TaxID=573496 RepID=UPI0021180233|nr:7-carboxy-7-deazaguanine synthase QueE [Frankia sp. AvcI1]